MKGFRLLRQVASQVILLPMVALLHLWLSYHVFILMLGCAFAGELGRWAFLLVVLGAGGGFLLTFLPSIIWPRSRFFWPFCYAAITMVFGLASFGEIGSPKGLWPFLVWTGCGVLILIAGLCGGIYGRRVANRILLNQMPNDRIQHA